MARNGSGTYTLPQSPFVPGTTISSSAVNSDLSDIATALTGSVAANGETTITGQLKGSVSASPCYTFSGDLDTGWGSSAADTLYTICGGTSVVAYSATGVSITGTLAISGGFSGTITTSDSSVGFVAFEGISTEAAAAAGPVYSLYRNSASPAASDFLGAIDFFGRNSITTKTRYGRIVTQITDPTNGSEDASIFIQRIIAGAFSTAVSITDTGVDTIGLLTATTGVKVGANPTATVGKAPTYQVLTSGAAATYTTPASVTWIKVRAWGGGGGGGGTTIGSGGPPTGTAGNSTTFNSIVAAGGTGGAGGGNGAGTGGAGGTGGSGVIGATAGFRIKGSDGQGAAQGSAAGPGGGGGNSPFLAGGGACSVANGAGGNGQTNSGGGGAGASGNLGANSGAAGGGGSGEYYEMIISAPSATYTYTIGATSTPQVGGSFLGGLGAAGRIIVEEYYS